MDSDSERSLKRELGKQRLERYRQKKSRREKKTAASAEAAPSSDGPTSGTSARDSGEILPSGIADVEQVDHAQSSVPSDASVALDGSVAGNAGAEKPPVAVKGDDVMKESSASPMVLAVESGNGQSARSGDGSGDLASSGHFHTSNDISPIPYDELSLGTDAMAGADPSADDLLARASDILAEHSTDVSSSSHRATGQLAGQESTGDFQKALSDTVEKLHASERQRQILEERVQMSEQQMEDAISHVQDEHRAELALLKQTHLAEVENIKRQEADSIKQAIHWESQVWQTEREVLRSSVRQLEDTVSAERTAHEAQLATKESEKRQLQVSMDDMTSEMTQLSSTVQKLTAEVSQANKTSIEQQQWALALQDERDSLSVQLRDREKTFAAEKETLQHDLATAKQQNSLLTSQVQKLEDATALSMSRESQAVQGLEISTLQQRLVEAGAERERTQTRVVELEDQLTFVQQRADLLATEHAAVQKAAKDDNEKMQNQILEVAALKMAAEKAQSAEESLHEQLLSVKKQNKTLIGEIDELTSQLSQSEATQLQYQSTVDSLQDERLKLQTEIASCQEANNRLSAACSEAQERLEQSKLAQGQLQAALEENRQMLEDVSAGMLANTADDDGDDEKVRLRDELATAEQENENMKQKLSASEEASRELQRAFTTQLLDLENRKDQVDQHLASVQVELEEESNEKRKLADELQSVTEKLQHQETLVKKWESNFSEKVSLVDEQESQIQKLTDDCSDLQSRVLALSKKEQDMLASLEGVNEELLGVKSEKAALAEQVAAEKRNVASVQASLSDSHRTDLQQALQRLSEEHSVEMAELSSRHAQEMRALEERVQSEADTRVSELSHQHQAECQRLKERIGSKEAEHQEEQAQTDLMRLQASQLESDAAASREILASCSRALGIDAVDGMAAIEESKMLISHIQRTVADLTEMRSNLVKILEVLSMDHLQADQLLKNPQDAVLAVSLRLKELVDDRNEAEVRMKEEFQQVVQQSEAARIATEKEHQAALLRAAEERQEVEAKLQNERDVVSLLQEQEMSELERVRQECSKALQAAQADHHQELENLTQQHSDAVKQVERLQSDIEQLRQEHASAVEDAKASHLVDAQKLAAEHAAELAGLMERYQQDLAAKDSTQAEAGSQLILQHEEDMKTLKEEHAGAISHLQEQFADERDSLTDNCRKEQEAAVALACKELDRKHAEAIAGIDQVLSDVRAEKASLERHIQELHDGFSAQLRLRAQQSADDLEMAKNELVTTMAEKEEYYKQEISSLQQSLEAQLDSHDATVALDSQRALLESEKEDALQQLQSKLVSQHASKIAALQEEHVEEMEKVTSHFKAEQSRLHQNMLELDAAAQKEESARQELLQLLRSSEEKAAQKEMDLVSLRSSAEELKKNYDSEVAAVREESSRLLSLQSSTRENELRQHYEAALDQLRSDLEKKTAEMTEELQSTLEADKQLQITSLQSEHEERIQSLMTEHQQATEAEVSRLQLLLIESVEKSVDEVKRGMHDLDQLTEWPGLQTKLVSWSREMAEECKQSAEQKVGEFTRLVEQLSSATDDLEDGHTWPGQDSSPQYVQKLIAWRRKMESDRQQLASLTTNVEMLDAQVSGHEQQVKLALEKQKSVLVAKYVQTFEETTKELEEASQLKLQEEISKREEQWQAEMQRALDEQQKQLEEELKSSGDDRLSLVKQHLEEEHQKQLSLQISLLQGEHGKELQSLQDKLMQALSEQEKQFQEALSLKQADFDQSVALCQEYSQSLEQLKADAEATLGQQLVEQETKLNNIHLQAMEKLRTQFEEEGQAIQEAAEKAQESASQPLLEQIASLETAKTSAEEQLATAQEQVREVQAVHQKFVTTHLATAIAEAEKWQGSCKAALTERDEARVRATTVQRTFDEYKAYIAEQQVQVSSLQKQLVGLQEADESREVQRNRELEEVSNLLRLVEGDKERLQQGNTELSAANQKLLALLSSLAQSIGKSSDALTTHRRRLRTLSAREQPEGQQQQQQQQLQQQRHASPAHASMQPVVVSLGESFAANTGAAGARRSLSYAGSSPLMSSTMNDEVQSHYSSVFTAAQTALRSDSTTTDSGLGGVAATSSSESIEKHSHSQHPAVSEDSEGHRTLSSAPAAEQSALPLSLSSLPLSQLDFSFETTEANSGDVTAALLHAVQKLWSPCKDVAATALDDATRDELSQDFNESMFEGPTVDEESEALLCRVADDLQAALRHLFVEHGQCLAMYQSKVSEQDSKVKSLSASCSKLQACLEQADEEMGRVQSECKLVVANLEAQHAEKLASVEEGLAVMENKLTEAMEEKESLSHQCGTLQSDVTQLQTSCQTLKQEKEHMSQLFAVEQGKLQESIASLQGHLSRAEVEKQAVEQKATVMAQEIATVSLLQERLGAVSAENEDLRQQLDEHLEQLKLLEEAQRSKGGQGTAADLDGDDIPTSVSEVSQDSSLHTLASERSEYDGARGDQYERILAEWKAALLSFISEWANESKVGLNDVINTGADIDSTLSQLGQLRSALSTANSRLAAERNHLAGEVKSMRKQLEERIADLEQDAARLTDHLKISNSKIGELDQQLAIKNEELALAEEQLAAASERSETNLLAMEESMKQRHNADAEALQQSIRDEYQQQLNNTLASVQTQHQGQLESIKDGHLAIVEQLVQQHALEVEKLTQLLPPSTVSHIPESADNISLQLLSCLDGVDSLPEPTSRQPSSSFLPGLALQLCTVAQDIHNLSQLLSQLKLEDVSVAQQLRAERDALQTSVHTLQRLLDGGKPGRDDDSLRNDILDALQQMFAQQRDLLSRHAGQSTSDVLLQQQKIWDAERALLHSEIQQLQRSLETLRQESQQHAAELQAKLAARDKHSLSLVSLDQLQQQMSDSQHHVSQLQASLTSEKKLTSDLQKSLASQLAELETCHVTISSLSQQLSAAQQSAAHANLQLRTEQQRTAELHRSLDVLQAESKHLASAESTSIVSLKAALDEQSHRLELLRSEFAGKETSWENEVCRLKEEAAQASRQMDLAVEAERERGQQLLAQEAAGAAEIRRLLEEERRQALSASRKSDTDRDQVRRASDQLRAAEIQQRELRAELQKEQMAALDANSKILKLEEQAARLSSSFADQQLTMTQLRTALTEKTMAYEELESRLTELDHLRRQESEEGHERAQIQLQSALKTVQEQVRNLTSQLEAEQRTVQELSAKEQIHSTTYASLQHDKDKLETQLSSLRQQLKTSNEALTAQKSLSATEDGCFKCRVSVPRLQRQHDDMAKLAERLSQERGRIQDELNQVMEKERRLRRDHQQLRTSAQVAEQQRVAEQASWQRERTSLLKQLSGSPTSGVDSGMHDRYARAERFRRELSFQKQYLMTLLGGFADCEEAVLQHVQVPSLKKSTRAAAVTTKAKANRFVVVARAVIAVCRMKRFVASPPVPRPLPGEALRRTKHLLPKQPAKTSVPSKMNGHRQPLPTNGAALQTHGRSSEAAIPSVSAVAFDNVSEAESSLSDAAYRAHLQRLNRLQDRLNSVALPPAGQ